MANISDPYTTTYAKIAAVTDPGTGQVELIEFFDCIGGAMWCGHHYAQSPLVTSTRVVGSTMRYLLREGKVTLDLEGSRFPAGISEVTVNGDEVGITYIGMGGGGVGAACARSNAGGVTRSRSDPAGGGKVASATIWVPTRQRVLIGVDDTDTPEAGATWTLAHNIAKEVEDQKSMYLAHTIVQLFPVPFRTRNCVGLVCEFATTDPAGLTERFKALLEEYTLSDETGMAVFTGFDPAPLRPFGEQVKRGQVSWEDLQKVKDERLTIVLKGRGAIGAVAAIPFSTRYQEALELWNGNS